MSAPRPLLLRNTRFLRLWIGQLLSQGGTRMYQLGIMWFLLSSGAGEGAKNASIFMVMTALPALVFVKLIGRTVDTAKSRSILVVSDLLSGSVALVLALSFRGSFATMPLILACGFLLAAFQGFFDPTLNKALPDIVDQEDLETGVAFMASTQAVASFSGAVLGGLLFDLLGIAGVLVLTMSGFWVSALLNASIFREERLPTRDRTAAEETVSSGWAILNDHPLLKKTLIGFGCVNFFSMPILVILPLYTQKALNGSASLLGALEACLWIGLIAGASAARFIHTAKTLWVGTICIFAFGLCLVLPGFFVNPILYGGVLFAAGLALGINNVKFISLFQRKVASPIKGRFFTLMQAMISFAAPMAYFSFGFLGDALGPQRATLAQGLGIMALSLYFLHLSRAEEPQIMARPLDPGVVDVTQP